MTLRLLAIEISHADEFHQLIQKNEDRLRHSFPGTLSQNGSLDDSKNYCQKIELQRKQKTYFPFVIQDTSSDKFIGMIDLKKIVWKIPKAEIGYFVDREYEGKGITSQALDQFVQLLMNKFQFKKLLCRIDPKNIGSTKVALKNGFELEGTIRNDHVTSDGMLVDIAYYGRCF